MIQLRQQQTKRIVSVPVHCALKAALNAARETADGPLIVTHRSRPLPCATFNHAFTDISLLAGTTELQACDLRRNACVRMAEAGATEKQIAAVTGHSIDETRGTLETNIPTTLEMAQAASAKLQAHERVGGRVVNERPSLTR